MVEQEFPPAFTLCYTSLHMLQNFGKLQAMQTVACFATVALHCHDLHKRFHKSISVENYTETFVVTTMHLPSA